MISEKISPSYIKWDPTIPFFFIEGIVYKLHNVPFFFRFEIFRQKFFYFFSERISIISFPNSFISSFLIQPTSVFQCSFQICKSQLNIISGFNMVDESFSVANQFPF